MFISSYDEGYVVINKKQFRNLIIIKENRVLQENNSSDIFNNYSFDKIIKNISAIRNIDLFLFGTGMGIIEMPDNIQNLFFQSKIKFEIMNSIAAYKTYNILLHERRNFISIIKVL